MKQLLALFIFWNAFSYSQVLQPQLYMIDGFDLIGEDFQLFKSDSSTIITGRGWYSGSRKFLMKINQSGTVDTVISVDSTNDGQFWSLGKPSEFDILESIDSNVLLLSTSHSATNQFYQKVRKLSVDLNPIWEKSYELPFSTFHSSFTELSDGNILFDSYSDSINVLTMIDPDGNTLWSRSFLNNIRFYNNHFVEADSNHFIASFGSSYGSILQKWDRNGTLIWTKSVEDFEFFSLKTDSIGNNYLMSYDATNTNLCLVKTDSNGTVIHSKVLDATFYLYSKPEGNIHFYNDDIVFGFGPSNSTSRAHYIVSDTSLTVQNLYGAEGGYEQIKKFNDSLFVLESSGGAYAAKLVGPRELGIYRFHQMFDCKNPISFNQNNVALNLVSDTTTLDTILITEAIISPDYVSHNGYLYGISCPFLQFGSTNNHELQKLKIYPNPSKGLFNLESEDGKIIESIEIHSTDGRLVYKDVNIKKSKSKINLNGIPLGIYYIKAKFGSEVVFEKIVVSG